MAHMPLPQQVTFAHMSAAGDPRLENLFHYLRLARATGRGREIRSRHMRGAVVCNAARQKSHLKKWTEMSKLYGEKTTENSTRF